MKLIAIETSTEACSVALLVDGSLRERHEIAPRRHGELVLPWIDALLAEAGLAKSALDAVAVGRGPGAFTGVRLGIAVAQGIGFALDRPLVPVSTLATLAFGANAAPGTPVLAAIDARMGEVYLAGYRIDADGIPLETLAERLCAPDAAEVPATEHWHAIGTGFAAVDGALLRRFGERVQACDSTALPRAGDVARLAAHACARGEAIAADRIEPAYLRDKVAQTLAERGKAG